MAKYIDVDKLAKIKSSEFYSPTGWIPSSVHGIPVEDGVCIAHKGEWEIRGKFDEEWYCNKCGHIAYYDNQYGYQLFDFCPYCGSLMRNTEEGH